MFIHLHLHRNYNPQRLRTWNKMHQFAIIMQSDSNTHTVTFNPCRPLLAQLKGKLEAGTAMTGYMSVIDKSFYVLVIKYMKIMQRHQIILLPLSWLKFHANVSTALNYNKGGNSSKGGY